MFLLNFIPDSYILYAINISLIAGIVGTVLGFFLGFLPIIGRYSIPLKIISIILLVGGAYFKGSYSVESDCRNRMDAMEEHMIEKNLESKQVTQKVITKYVETVRIVKEKGDVIIKEVPKYITKESDAKCDIPKSFVVLHDAAAISTKTELPNTPRGIDESSSGTKLSTVTETVVGNYSICHQNAEQLKALQNWIVSQQKLFNN